MRNKQHTSRDTLVHGRCGFAVATKVRVEDGKVKQGVLMICLDVIYTLALHRVVKVTMEKLDGFVVRTTSPSIEEAVWVSMLYVCC